MDGKKTNTTDLLKEMLVYAFRLVMLMTSIDKMNSIIILACWAIYTVLELGFIYLNAEIMTSTYELLTSVTPRNQALKTIIGLCGTKLILTTTCSTIEQFRNFTERKFTKRLRKKMTLLLLESFTALDYTTQCNAQVIRDFSSSRTFLNSSIIRSLQEIMKLLAYSLKAAIIAFSLAGQIRNRERLVTLPYIGIWLFIDMAVTKGKCSNSSRLSCSSNELGSGCECQTEVTQKQNAQTAGDLFFSV